MKNQKSALSVAGYLLLVFALVSLCATGGVAQVGKPSVRPLAKPSAAKPPATKAIPSVNAIATSRLKTLSTTLRVVDAETNYDELAKIGGNFKTQFRATKSLKIAYKYPNRVRLEAKVIGLNVTQVFNGDMRVIQAPFKKDVRNIKGQPGQKQSLMQMGVFAKDWIATDYEPVFLRREGNELVFKLVQRDTNNKSHEVVWVNPKTALISRRMTYNGEDVLQQESRYKNPVQYAPGVWLPTRVELYNQFGKRGGVQVFQDTQVNAPLDDKLFPTS